jgi:uracil-DNA glycosylase
MTSPVEPNDWQEALAMLARGLAGAMEVAAVDALPRPRFTAPSKDAVAPPPQQPAVVAPVIEPALVPIMPVPTMPVPIHVEALTDATLPAADRLRVLQNDVIGACTRCKLHRGRNRVVFGAGNPQAKVVFVGEGPGAEEDRTGVPLVGRAGELLSKMIEAMGLTRADVYICNVVKCRPPNNRDPEPDEVAACDGFLREQLAIIKPAVIVTLGRHAALAITHQKTPISKLRGTWHDYQGIPVMPTYHPSYLLRTEDDPEKKVKREAWSDLQQVMKRLGLERTR